VTLASAGGEQAFVFQSPAQGRKQFTIHHSPFTIQNSALPQRLSPESCLFHNPTYYPSLLSAACQETECPRGPGAAMACPPLPCSCGKATSAGWRVDSYRRTLCRLSHTFLRYRPFRLSTLDPRLPQEGGEFQIRLARLLPGILSTVLSRHAQRARTPFLGCHNHPSLCTTEQPFWV
jgi:hypothetical protein